MIIKVLSILKQQGANCFTKNFNNLESIHNEDKIDFFFCPAYYNNKKLSFHNKIIQNLFETRKLCERIIYTNYEPSTITPQEGLHIIKRHTKQDLYPSESLKELHAEDIRKMLQITVNAMERLDMAAEEKTM